MLHWLLGESMAFGLAVEDFGAKPFTEIATGATPPVCTAAKPTSGLSRERTFYSPGKGWCREWHPSVSAFTGYRAGRFPAWEQPPGNLHTSKLTLHSTSKTLGHLVQSWLELCLSVGSWLPCGMPFRRCSSSQRICYPDSATADWSRSSSRNWTFSSRFVAVSPASALALALAWLVPSFGLGTTRLVRPAIATALLPLVSPHECGVIPLSN